ncbi:MAG: ATP-binding protein [Chloroflexia bacterium]
MNAEAPTLSKSAAGEWPVVGHGAAVGILRRALTGRLAHAYLLIGPPQSGKATLARLFAQALFCTGDPAALGEEGRQPDVPCGRCRNCTRIARGVYPDVDWYSLARQAAEPEQQGKVNKDLSIGTIRALQSGLSLRPYEGEWRVAVLEDADAMSLPAANALLKTLEEPPPYAVLLLLAADPSTLPTTIPSRSQIVTLRPLGREVIAAALRERGTAPARAELLAALSGGRFGWAAEAAAHPERLASRDEQLDSLAALPAADLPARFAWAADLAAGFSQNRPVVFDALTQLAIWWRDLLVVRVGAPSLVQNTDRLPALEKAAGRLSPQQIGSFLAAVTAAQEQLSQNVSPRLVLESLMLAMPGS